MGRIYYSNQNNSLRIVDLQFRDEEKWNANYQLIRHDDMRCLLFGVYSLYVYLIFCDERKNVEEVAVSQNSIIKEFLSR